MLKRQTEQNIQDLWDHFKRCNTCVIGKPGSEERDNVAEEKFEVARAENFLKLMTNNKQLIWESKKI